MNGAPAPANDQRRTVLAVVEDRLEWPMLILSAVWLALFVLELTVGLSGLLEAVGTGIWAIFVFEFLLRFWLAPEKLRFLGSNWLTLVALLLPALRIVRVARVARLLRAARVARATRFARLVTATQRGRGAVRRAMTRRGLGYVVASTAIVIIAGSAGMYAFEHEAAGGALPDYGAALWWTAMVLATMGSDYWPRTGLGRALCLLLALYGFAVFGYFTAYLASFFVGSERRDGDSRAAASRANDRGRGDCTSDG